ncbi:MAG TPA: class I SAM-dependent methyltransferase [Candidatus Paceibacterota bacterium]|jgi:23S rRNA (cytosine1962-C5)-methyltransferase|nr:class I SAM-dependent methyltransferase [Candidatus Paceibacterota bacterium]
MILKIEKQKEYELLDGGEGCKLERYGPYILSRPDPEALWRRLLPEDVWDKAELKFIRNGERTKWIIKEVTPKSWNITLHNLIFAIKPTSFKHIGLFPEQAINWQWMENIIKKNKRDNPISVLNLFAYTGGATMACARAGAEVCHVDGSKTAVAWARQNAELSGLENAPIRWITDDVIQFMKREIKRGRKYDAIVMDPPAFGHGPKDELWKIEENFLELMDLGKQILSENPLFVLINGYTAGYSPITYENNLKDMMKRYNGVIESGELVIEESKSNRLLPCGIFARWSKN